MIPLLAWLGLVHVRGAPSPEAELLAEPRLAATEAARHAEQVDREAAFPHQAFALLRHHGLDPARWPAAVCETLGGS